VPPLLASAYRELILRLAVQHRLPAVVGDNDAAESGLMSYGPNRAERSILCRPYPSWDKPGELPVGVRTRRVDQSKR
jgi:putative ABC transport system substrate-binding protein